MKISIVVPIFRSLNYIGDCLDSLEAQKDKDFEVILVSDHLEEYAKLVEEAESRKDKLSIRVCELTEGNGVAAARNLGMSLASGDYICFLDDDDYLNSNAISIFTAGIEGRKFTAEDLDDDIQSRMVLPRNFSEEENFDDLAQPDLLSAKIKRVRVGRDTYLADLLRRAEQEEEQEDEQEEEQQEEKETQDNTKKSRNQMLLEEAYAGITLDKKESSYRTLANITLIGSQKKMARTTVLGTVFRREFLEQNAIRFHEEYTYYSDVLFLVDAINALKSFKRMKASIYYKRTHNDTINDPALSQVKDEARFDEFIRAYSEAKANAQDALTIEYLERQFVRYFVSTFAVSMKRKEDESWKKERFETVKSILSDISDENLYGFSKYSIALVYAARKGNTDTILRKVKVRLAKKKVEKMLSKQSQFCKAFYGHVYYKKPVKENYVIFESFFGKSYTDSPKYIYEYLQKNYPGEYKCIWVIDDKNAEIPYDHIKVKRFSIRYAYYMAVCKFIVFNMRQPLWIKLKKDQTLLETWHGIPIKRLVFDQDEVTGPNIKYKEQVYKGTRDWTYLISPNRYCTEVFKRCFMFENEIIETGYPRNDILQNQDPQLVDQLKKKIGIPEGKKAILYAPTFRDNEFYKPGEYKYKCALDFNQLKEAIGDEYILLMRTHYLIADAVDISGLEDFIINVCHYPDIAELYLVSDMMISDYSSVAFDYANLRRPMIYYTYDLEDYRDNLRGFYIDIEKELPGPLVYTTEEVAESIKNIDQISKQYKERYDAFYEKYCHLEDGHSTERVVKKVFGK